MNNTLIFILVFFISCCVHANTALIQRLNANNAQHQENILNSKEEIDRSIQKIQDLDAEMAKAKKALEAATSAASRARIAQSSNPSAAHERELKTASDLMVLAERKVKSRTARLERERAKLDEQRKSSSDSTAAINRNNLRIQDLRTQEEKSKVQQEQLNAARALAESQLAAEKQAASAKAQLAATKAAKNAPEPVNVPAPPTPEPIVEPEQAIVPEPPASPAQEEIDELKVLEQEERDYAQKRVAEINEHVADASSKRPEHRRLIGTSNTKMKLEFEHLGGEIYSVTSPFAAGEHAIKIVNVIYTVRIEDADDGEEYTLYYDNRRSSRGKLLKLKTAFIRP